MAMTKQLLLAILFMCTTLLHAQQTEQKINAPVTQVTVFF